MDARFTVAEVTYCNSITVAEHVVMMILGLVRNYMPSYETVVGGGWNIADCAARSYDVEGMQVGTVAAGRIGSAVRAGWRPSTWGCTTPTATACRTIELNRPDALNAWNEQMGLDLTAALTTVSGDAAVRAVMITGAGRASPRAPTEGGARPGRRWPAGPEPAPEGARTTRSSCASARCRSRSSPRSTGPQSESGRSLALACDLLVAAESAYFLPRLRQRSASSPTAGPRPPSRHGPASRGRRDGDAGRARPGRSSAGVAAS